MPWDIYLIFFFLAVALPWRGRLRLKTLLAKPHVGSAERISLYASTIAFQWCALAIVAWRAWVHRFSASELGLVATSRVKIAILALAGAATLSTLHWLNLRRIGGIPPQNRGFIQALAERILPQSNVELLPYIALAITAGVCEELIYRGFAMAALARAGLPGWGAVLISAVLFGLAHLYQGRGGFIGTLLIGLVFGITRLVCAAVAVVIVWHIAVDIVAGVAARRYLLNSGTAAPASCLLILY